MNRARRIGRLSAVICASFLVVAGISVPAMAQSKTLKADDKCDSKFRGTVPILMVHGFNGSSKTWDTGSTSMASSLRQIKNGTVVPAFDYSNVNREWVTHPSIGQKLAQRIDCLARKSQQEGGLGKVIVVAYSMGGLAVRQAASLSVDNVPVSNRIGFVVGIGVPNSGVIYDKAAKAIAGSKAGRAMLGNSREIKALPKLPSNVPAKMIAGDVSLMNVRGKSTKHLRGDGLVSTSSVHAGASRAHGFGGSSTVRCLIAEKYKNDVTLNKSSATCAHNNQIRDAAFQAAIKKDVEQFIKSKNRKTVTAGRIFMNVDKRFTSIAYEGKKAARLEVTKNCRGKICEEMFIWGPGASRYVPELYNDAAYKCKDVRRERDQAVQISGRSAVRSSYWLNKCADAKLNGFWVSWQWPSLKGYGIAYHSPKPIPLSVERTALGADWR